MLMAWPSPGSDTYTPHPQSFSFSLLNPYFSAVRTTPHLRPCIRYRIDNPPLCFDTIIDSSHIAPLASSRLVASRLPGSFVSSRLVCVPFSSLHSVQFSTTQHALRLNNNPNVSASTPASTSSRSVASHSSRPIAIRLWFVFVSSRSLIARP